MVTNVQALYTDRADEYIALLGSMQSVHPSDEHLVSVWAAQIDGLVLDAGCGPGHWAGHLAAQGVRMLGIDQVPAFLEHARAAHEGVSFREGSIDELPLAASSVAGVLAWYSLIHYDPTPSTALSMSSRAFSSQAERSSSDSSSAPALSHSTTPLFVRGAGRPRP